MSSPTTFIDRCCDSRATIYSSNYKLNNNRLNEVPSYCPDSTKSLPSQRLCPTVFRPSVFRPSVFCLSVHGIFVLLSFVL